MRKSEEEQGTVLLRWGKSILLGGAIGFLTSIAFLLLVSMGIARGILDANLSYQFTVVSCVLGSFCGGIFAVKQSRGGKGLLLGLAAGIVLFLLQLSLGVLFSDGAPMENGGLGLLFGTLCGGTAAGILVKGTGGTSRGKKRRKH